MLLRTLLMLVISMLAFGAAPKTSASDDGVIEANIRAKFAKSKINEEHFKVSVKAGVAVLEGKTAVPQRKGVATRLAKSAGARQVVNKIEVSEAARKQLTERLQRGRERKPPAPRPSSVETKSAPAPPAAPADTASAAPAPESGPQPLRRMQIKR